MIIKKIEAKDIPEWEIFFRETIKPLVIKENIHIEGFIDEEVEDKLERIYESIKKVEPTSFFIAIIEDNIVGCIGFNKVSDIIVNILGNQVGNSFEISSVYVHPRYQKLGIGRLLFDFIHNELTMSQIGEYYLDSGYTSSQKYWRKILGEPSHIVEDYWGLGTPHMIWHKMF